MTLDIITHEALEPLKHGFFTRRGGASSGVFEGLNCGRGSSDQSESVAINRARVAEAMGVEEEALTGVYQVHSPDVVVAEGPLPRDVKADALVTNRPGLALSILTADCQPVLFADAEAGVIGAAHAGWKGALGGVLENTIEAMEGLGARRGNIAAVIGPSISQRNYEVGEEFRDAFLENDPAHARYFCKGQQDKWHFDLPGFGLARLKAAGVGRADWTRNCTYADPDRFFSYRRATHRKEADYGRLIAAIRL